MGERRRRFSEEFKRDVVEAVTVRGEAVSQVASDLDLRPDMVRRWIRKVERQGSKAFPGKGSRTSEAAELSRLRRENALLKKEREILKKAVAIFSEPER